MLPLLLLAAFVVRRDVQLQRDAVERGMRDTTRALLLAVDREVGSILAVAQTLAASQYVDSSDFKAFYDLSSATADTRNGSWVALFGRTGQMIINSREPLGASLPNPLREGGKTPDGKTEGLPFGNPAIKTVLETGRPGFSDLYLGLVSKRPTLSVTVPITRDGKVTHALSMSVASDHLISLLREQGLPAGWIGVLIDKKGTIIGRTAAPEKLLGRPAPAPLMKHLSEADERSDTGRVQVGIPIYYSVARSKLTEWGIAIGVPQATIDAPVNRSIRIMAGGAALLLLVAVGAALAFGRRISIPISRLAQSAEAIQHGLPVELQGSAVAEVKSLHQALLHAGARKFSNRGGQVSVTITEEADRKSAFLRISDNGIGIKPEMLARVFEPFVQGEKSLNPSSTGLGLGLALVKGLVELHGGEVRSSSDGPDRGSEFAVRLPLVDVPVPVVTRNGLPAKASPCHRILIIEDNLAAAQSLNTYLAKTGHTAEVALSGSDAVVAALKFGPEVVLCDIGLPGLDGYAVARLLRQHPKLKSIYLIAMSGYGQEYDQRRALEAGFDKYLTKPIDLSELERLLDVSELVRQAASA